jgi:hypothetical protein
MMKRIALVLAMVPALASANDIAPGTFELSGGSNLGLSSTSAKYDGGGTVDFSNNGLAATGLYYVMPNVAVGGTFQWASNSTKWPDGSKDTSSTFLIGPAASIEFPVAPQFGFYGRGDLGYVSQTQSQVGAPDLTLSGWGLGLEAGVKYFPVQQVSFDAGLAYRYTSTSTNTSPSVDVSTSGIGLNVGLSVYFK